MKKLTALLFAVLMAFSLAACDETNADPAPDEQGISVAEAEKEEYKESQEEEQSEEEQGSQEEEQQTEEMQEDSSNIAEDEVESEPSASSQSETADGLRPEFKEAMDSYEAFYTEYCDFLVKYEENPTDLELLAEYADMMTRLSEMEETFAEWDDADMSDEELAYYLEVTNRVAQKLLEIS